MTYKKDSFIVLPNKKYLKGKPSQLQSVYLWICEHADEDGICFPGRELIAEEAGVNIKSVDKYIKKMVEDEVLVKSSRKKIGTNQNLSNQYQIMILPEEVAPKTVPRGTENGARGGTENGAGTLPIRTQPNELPLWLNREAWGKWGKYRKDIRKKLTPLTVDQQLEFLSKNQADHVAIILQSIQAGWTGLFPLKRQGGKVATLNQGTEHRTAAMKHVEDTTVNV